MMANMEQKDIAKIIDHARSKGVSDEAIVGRIVRRFVEGQGFTGAKIASGYDRARDRSSVTVRLRQVDYTPANIRTVDNFMRPFLYTQVDLKVWITDGLPTDNPKVDFCTVDYLTASPY